METTDPITKLTLIETGSSEGASVVFLHGGGGAGWMWQPQIERMGDYHLLVPDLPEHGGSQEVKPFTIRGAAEAIAELIRCRANGGRAHVVGLSEGGQVAVMLLSLAPELVERVVVSGVLVRPAPGSAWMTPGLLAATHKWFMESLKNHDGWIRLNMKYAAGIPEQYFPQFKATFRQTTREAFIHLMLENRAFRLPQGLGQVSSPVLVVAGRKEDPLVHASAHDLVAAIPGARGVVAELDPRLPRAAHHNWSMAAPQLFTQMLRCWFGKQPLPGELKPL